ncbi:MAG: MFS transporter [Candidatus Melainabacteria bacterium]|nr:MFS transporter [Candidatus Melainabacteria bacterium]
MAFSKPVNSSGHVLVASSLGGFFDGLDASIFGLVLYPALSELLHTSSHSLAGIYGSYILATFLAGWAIGAVVFGVLSDTIGRVKAMMLSIAVYALFTGLCALSHSWQELAAYRFLVGCGIGGEMGSGLLVLSEHFRGKARLHTTGLMMAALCAGWLCTSLINFWIGHLGWRMLFVVGIIPALLTVYIRAKLKEPTKDETVNDIDLLDRRNGLLRAVMLIGQAPLKFKQLFASANRPKVMVVMLLASSIIVNWWAVLTWVPAWINQMTGTQAVFERSLVTSLMYLGAILSSMLGGISISYLGRLRTFFIGYLGAMLSELVMFLTVQSVGPLLLCLSFFVGLFAILPFYVLFVYVPEIFNHQIRGTAFGFSVQMGRFSAVVAVLLSGQLIALFGGSYALAGLAVAMINIVGLAALLFLPESPGEVLVPVGDDSQRAQECHDRELALANERA